MSDQYTRITTGGSPLPKNSPVVGLLFGNTTDKNVLQVLDAGEISTDLSDQAKQQVGLHQAVFPQHNVVGWYRVSSTETTPNANDLATTRKLQAEYEDCIFCFTQANHTDAESLPMTLYQVEDEVLVACEDNWKLETSEAERIAVETVVRQEPNEVVYVTHIDTMEQALQKLMDRLNLLLQFLQDTSSGKIPFHPSLMRQVQSVVMQLGPLVASSPEPTGPELWLPHMAVAAKTVQAVQGYTEKMKSMQEHRISSSRGRF